SKTFMTLSVFVLVKDAKDINNAALALAIPLLLPGIIPFIYIYNRQLARVVSFSFRGIVKELKDGGALFISQIAISFYTTFNTLILGYIF
ncbi:flippase, partial [Escherichia coli]|nr:flippase [Escherichia coli]